MPRYARWTRPCSINSSAISFAALMGIANPIPSAHRPLQHAPIRERRQDLLRAVDDVVVREDVALRVEHDAGSDAPSGELAERRTAPVRLAPHLYAARRRLF